LSISQAEGQFTPPDNTTLTRLAGLEGLITALKQLNDIRSWNPFRMICIGHGLGGYLHCQLAKLGIVAAGYVFASGIFSDYEFILSQKYTMVLHAGPSEPGPDPVSVQIAQNLSLLLNAIRKGKKQLKIENNDTPIMLDLEPMLFRGTQTPRYMFRHIISPTMIIHGSSDLDISPWNASSIDQSLRNQWIIPERIILSDRDHWFRETPYLPVDKFMERLNGECFSRPIDTRLFSETVSFIRRAINQGNNGSTPQIVQGRFKQSDT
jgi:pimeloyl-ACP methyl ester carboxylesterase